MTRSEPQYMDVMCLLKPIGDDRRERYRPTKGKRARKRTPQDLVGLSSGEVLKFLGPPKNFHHITAGLNEVGSLLEIEARKSAPEALQRQYSGLVGKKRKRGESEEEPNPLIAVFAALADVDGPDYSDRYHIFSHLPDLVARASLSPTGPNIYLVSLPKGAMYKIGEAMDLGRIGLLGLRQNAPGTSLLLTFLKENVPLCTLPTLEVKRSEAGKSDTAG